MEKKAICIANARSPRIEKQLALRMQEIQEQKKRLALRMQEIQEQKNDLHCECKEPKNKKVICIPNARNPLKCGMAQSAIFSSPM